MRTTKSVVVARTDEMKMPSGREKKREAMSKSPIDETLLATWQRHDSSRAVYQRITEMSKQAGSLILRMSPNIIDKYKRRQRWCSDQKAGLFSPFLWNIP